MKSIWIFLLLGSSAVILAQAQDDQETTAGIGAGDVTSPCVPAGEELAGNPEQDGNINDAVPCEEQDPEAIPEAVVEDAFADEVENEAKTTGDDVTAQEEFETGEEISEDYPVPLPSDI